MSSSGWDPQRYARLAGSMEGFATELLARVDLAPDSVVLDAGCGPGNVTELLLELIPDGWGGPWNFVSAAATRDRLAEAGFGQIEVWTEERPYRPAQPWDYLAGMVLTRHLERLPADLRDLFLDQVIDQLEPPLQIDYVRLNIIARA